MPAEINTDTLNTCCVLFLRSSKIGKTVFVSLLTPPVSSFCSFVIIKLHPANSVSDSWSNNICWCKERLLCLNATSDGSYTVSKGLLVSPLTWQFIGLQLNPCRSWASILIRNIWSVWCYVLLFVLVQSFIILMKICFFLVITLRNLFTNASVSERQNSLSLRKADGI